MSMSAIQLEVKRGEQWEQPSVEAAIPLLWPDSLGLTYRKTGRYSHIDMEIIDPEGETVGFIEVKRRFMPHSLYPSTMVAVEKHLKALDNQVRGIATYALIVWDDRVGVINLAEKPAEIRYSSRRDRANSQRQYAYYDLASQIRWLNISTADLGQNLGD